MPDVHIEHVIFTRVEKMYSPQGYSGYQIIYQSPSLGTETAQIEKYVQCFLTNKQQMNRYQFFRTAQGQAVFTKSVSLLSPDREVIDRDQRDAFLAHALVVSPEHFARVRNDPFAIFEAAENLHLLAENVEQIVSYLRKAPPEEIMVPIRKQAAYLPLDWSKEEIQHLYRLGEAAPDLNEQKKSLLMIAANPEETFRLLSCLLMLLPPSERAACTFDTFVDNCVPSPGSFWTIGSTKAINNSGFVPMRLAEHKAAPVKTNGNGSAYSVWFSYVLQNVESFPQLNEALYSAQVVAEAFKTKKALPDEPLNESVLHAFHRMNMQAINSSLYNALTTLVDKHIAEAIVPSLYASLPLPAVLSIAAQGTCTSRVLAKIVYRWLLNEQLEWKGWEDVLKFAERAEYAPLLLLASIKARPPWPFMNYEKLHLQAVQVLRDAGRLPQVLEDLLGGAQQGPTSPAPSKDAPSHRFELSDEEFQMVVNALLQQNAGNLLQTRFVQRVASLQSRKIVLGLTKAVSANKDVAPEFVQALHRHPLYSR
jgi:hypothetical protein